MKSILLLLLIFLPSLTYADYYFRSPAPGVIASTSTGGPEEEEPTEDDVACYDPANTGKIGAEGVCEDMLIVSREMMLNYAYPISGGQDMAIDHAESDRTFTYGFLTVPEIVNQI